LQQEGKLGRRLPDHEYPGRRLCAACRPSHVGPGSYGQSGMVIGYGDSVVPVDVSTEGKGGGSIVSGEQIQVGSRTIEVANLEVMVFPEEGITQGDLINIYRRLADTMLPHLGGRPLTMQRFPDGIGNEGFYQRKASAYFPDWIRRVSVEVAEDNGKQLEVVCDNEATLVYLVDQGLVTPHVWLSRVDKLDYPDKLIFDLDPPDSEFEPVRVAAGLLHDLLDDLGLVPFVMTTGSRGAHVAVPLDRSADFDTVRRFAHDVAKLVAQREPDHLTVEVRKDKRGDRLFIDYLRNAYGQNSVAPYGVRAKPGAPVATPLDWDELSDSALHSQSYTVRNIFRRLGQKDDPWTEIVSHARSLSEGRDRLDDMISRS
jgi:bifunctional non-homologous end joining protein LigD